MPILLLFACVEPKPPADPAVVLRELAEESGVDLYAAVYYGADGLDPYAMADGETKAGTLSLPADADPDHWESDGTLTAAWDVTFDEAEDPDRAYSDYWFWTIELDITTLTLPSAMVSGTATWSVDHRQNESMSLSHEWSGRLSIDGAEAVDAAWSGSSTWSTLNTMEGTIDGEAVAYLNPDQDQP